MHLAAVDVAAEPAFESLERHGEKQHCTAVIAFLKEHLYPLSSVFSLGRHREKKHLNALSSVFFSRTSYRKNI